MFYHPRMLSGMNAGYGNAVANKAPRSEPASLLKARSAQAHAVHRTLVPVDGSEEAHRAIEYVNSLARRGFTSEIHLLNVQPRVMPGDFTFDHVVQAEETARLAAAQDVMTRAQERLRAQVPIKVAVRFGRAADAIARYAKEQGINTIAMATRGKRSLGRLLRKSVAMDVVRRVDIPVMLLRRVDRQSSAPASAEQH
jgi:nucleotide-binding universal stress UspA family protein